MGPSRVGRRDWLKGVALGCAGAAAARSLARPSSVRADPARQDGAKVTVRLDDPIGIIRPALYSQFTEHIGGVIYDGIWVGPDSKIANIQGFRKTLVEHVRQLGPVVFRWPGGCFADKYHWRDGIGPTARRPRRYGRWKDVVEPNSFGTHEFLRFCRVSGVEPYLAGNVGTGTAEEFQSWVEYCNAPADSTTLAEERAANGDPQPFKVRYWGVGNESWGCGGKFTPEDYCTEYRKYTEWLPAFGTPLYLIAAGPNGNNVEWTRRFFKKWSDYSKAPIQGWAPHYYCGTTGHALRFSRDQWYEMLFKANKMEPLIADQWAAVGEFDPKRSIKLVIDEWGAWHPEGTGINPKHQFEQMGCLRDALVAALTLDTFNRHADKVAMANVAQLVNNIHSLFLADGDKFVATPNFHVFAIYRPHQGATSVRLNVEAPEVSFKAVAGDERIFRVAGSASVREKSLTMTLVHTHAESPIDLTIDLRGGTALGGSRTVLTDRDLNAHNTFENSGRVVPTTIEVAGLKGSSLRVTLPPASVTRFQFGLG